MTTTHNKAREIAKFFNENYSLKIKDIEFKKPSSEIALRFFNVVMCELYHIKDSGRCYTIPDSTHSISIPSLIYITQLTQFMRKLGFEDFDVVRDIANVDKDRFQNMCGRIMDYLIFRKQFIQQKNTMNEQMQTTKKSLEEVIGQHKTNETKRQQLLKKEEEDRPEVERINALIQNEIAKQDKIGFEITRIQKEIYALVEEITTIGKEKQELDREIKSTKDHNDWARNVIQLLREISTLSASIAECEMQIERLKDETNETTNQITSYSTIDQSCKVWKTNLGIVNEGIKRIEKIREELEKTTKERDEKKHECERKQLHYENVMKEFGNETTLLQTKEEERDKIVRECDGKYAQFEKDKKDLERMYVEVTKDVQESQSGKQYLENVLDGIEKRIKNVKVTHFAMVKELNTQISTLRELLKMLNDVMVQ